MFLLLEKVYRLGGSKGGIASPSYPSNYPEGIDYQYIITVPSGSRIKLKSADFDLENTPRCAYDYLSIFNGADDKAPLVGRFCGKTRPADFVSSGNFLNFSKLLYLNIQF